MIDGEEASASPSSDVDGDSLPTASVSDPLGTPPHTWLSDVDGSRWIDARDEGALNLWGSPTAARQTPFDPATAFEEPVSDEEEDSDTNGSNDGWQRKQEGSAPKRARREEPLSGVAKYPSTSETFMTDEVMDDEERSSGDFQGPGMEGSDDIIKALGPHNVRQLASMHSGDLQDLEERSSGGHSDDSFDDSSDPGSSEGGSAFATCVNCTHELDPMYSTCPDCGHDASEDAVLFSTTRVRQQVALQQKKATILAYDDRLAEHEEGRRMPHPERPDRIKAVIARLMSTGLADQCLRVPCREATKEELTACHTEALVTRVEEMAETASTSGREIGLDRVYFTSDTYVRPSTFRCASLAAGGCVEVATAVTRGEAGHGAAIVRPPGHHAESGMAMGFCFFNNAAVAARAAQKAGADKVLILDWDVHHGNGTQHIFENDPSVLYMSIHRFDGGYFFPGTGGPNEVGRGPGEGFTVNIPWPCGGMGNGDYLAAFNHVILPIAYEFAPKVIIVSAGFDAAAGDPLGGCRVTPEGFAHMTALLANIAPLAVLLEGGYNLTATALGTEATLRVLLGEVPPPLPNAGLVDNCASMAIQNVVRRQAKYWQCLRPFAEVLSFDPYTSPFLNRDHLPPAPAGLQAGVRGDLSSPRKSMGSESQLIMQKGGQPLPTSPRGIARALNRTKFVARHQQGKSQRKLQYMHALHLVALRHRLRNSKLIAEKLACRSDGHQRLAGDGLGLPSPSRRTSLRSPFVIERPTLIADAAEKKIKAEQ